MATLGKRYQIFISSTYDDLKQEREAVIKAVLEIGHIPVGMESFNAADETQWQHIARQIQVSDYYVVIVAHRYGSRTDDGLSYTEKEYNYAAAQKIPTLGFIIDKSALSRTGATLGDKTLSTLLRLHGLRPALPCPDRPSRTLERTQTPR